MSLLRNPTMACSPAVTALNRARSSGLSGLNRATRRPWLVRELSARGPTSVLPDPEPNDVPPWAQWRIMDPARTHWFGAHWSPTPSPQSSMSPADETRRDSASVGGVDN